MHHADFYRACFLNAGWIPSQDLARPVAVGDVAQICNGRLQTLLNLQSGHLVETLAISRKLEFGDLAWRLEQGVYQSLSEAQTMQGEQGELYAQTRQVLEFARTGDFLFHARKGHAHCLLNWAEIKDDVTLKLTQLRYQFRNAYVVTAVATMHEWGLAVAGQDQGRLEMSATGTGGDRYTLLSDESARADASRGMAVFETGKDSPAYFFRAKKLILSDATVDLCLARLAHNQAHLHDSEIARWLNADLRNFAQNGDVSLNTCMHYFSWCDMSLDDLALLRR
ncbi:hypothetical protein [uncultured Herbaspirillum sp.]|uniref:hypothetical protein n=1 Tax=uncultured Herbaspirillum sp. TaxID=160236 RepID=UPI00258AC02D|nr:hypothetical protein [uncultured Herbaspirillum sp.]